MSKKKLRPLGQVTTDMEKLILEMVEGHELQHGEVLNLIRGYLEIHCPDSQEQYVDGEIPTFYYGPSKQKN